MNNPILILGGFIILILLIAFLIRRVRYVIDIRWHATRLEDIIICSQFPGDREVRKRADHHRIMLKASANPTGVEVYEMYFGDAEFANETWEEFEWRCDLFRKERRRKRHIYLNERHRDLYLKHLHHQKNIRYGNE